LPVICSEMVVWASLPQMPTSTKEEGPLHNCEGTQL
jgi:hypothetical protein